jgi:hypothetical protein
MRSLTPRRLGRLVATQITSSTGEAINHLSKATKKLVNQRSIAIQDVTDDRTERR